MTMHLIVDGYNLIRQSSPLQTLEALDLRAGREALLELLTRYRRRSHHQVTVVFDGWQGGGLQESRDWYQGLLIIYSRRGERADEVIKRLLRQERQRVLVVTSDRDIQVCADRVKAAWINAGQFEPHLHEPAGMPAPAGEESTAPERVRKQGPARRLPKSQRRRRLRWQKL